MSAERSASAVGGDRGVLEVGRTVGLTALASGRFGRAEGDDAGADEGRGDDDRVAATRRGGYATTAAVPIGLRRQALAHEQPSVVGKAAAARRAETGVEHWPAGMSDRG